MGIFDFLKTQLVAVIEWKEVSEDVLAYRFPMNSSAIQNGAQLIVRDTEAALFANDGQVADVFGAGHYTLNTKNLPVLTALSNWEKGFDSPFKSDVYYFSLREKLDQRWGTAQPITVRDKEFGPVRIRAHGSFSYRLSDPKIFFKKLSGTRETYSTEDLDGQLRGMIVTSLATFFGHADISFLDMAANQTQFSETLKAALAPAFAEYGLLLTSFYVQSVSLPEELQTQIDRMGAMRMTGDLQKYAQFQTAESISIAAANAGGAAGAGVGMGAGVAMGQAMMNATVVGQNTNSAPAAAGVNSNEDALQKINQLHELMVKGVITSAEFDAKKTELLKRIT